MIGPNNLTTSHDDVDWPLAGQERARWRQLVFNDAAMRCKTTNSAALWILFKVPVRVKVWS